MQQQNVEYLRLNNYNYKHNTDKSYIYNIEQKKVNIQEYIL